MTERIKDGGTMFTFRVVSPKETERADRKELKDRLYSMLKDKDFFSEASIDSATAEIDVPVLLVMQYYRQQEDMCVKCGECCKRCNPIFLEPEEISQISSSLGMRIPEFHERFVEVYEGLDGDGFSLKHNPCVFLKGNRCVIYDVRPDVCRGFPFAGVLSFGFTGTGENVIPAYCAVVKDVLTHAVLFSLITKKISDEHPEILKEIEEDMGKHFKSEIDGVAEAKNEKELFQTLMNVTKKAEEYFGGTKK